MAHRFPNNDTFDYVIIPKTLNNVLSVWLKYVLKTMNDDDLFSGDGRVPDHNKR